GTPSSGRPRSSPSPSRGRVLTEAYAVLLTRLVTLGAVARIRSGIRLEQRRIAHQANELGAVATFVGAPARAGQGLDLVPADRRTVIRTLELLPEGRDGGGKAHVVAGRFDIGMDHVRRH